MINSIDKSRLIRTLFITLIVALMATSAPVLPQEAIKNGSVSPMGQWLEYRETEYNGQAILIHLRTGYERAVVMPEPVVIQDSGQSLPGCEIIINDNVVAFYPAKLFTRKPVIFIGKETGTVYELRVRASTEGIRQPLKINR